MIGPRNRRALLRTGALALSAGLAGCVGGLDGETSDDTPNATTAETQTPTQDATRTTDANFETETSTEPPLAVEDVRVQSSFFYLTTPDSAAVASSTETKFVFVDVRETTSSVLPPLSDDFTLVADGRRFDGTFELRRVSDPWDLYWQGPAYDPDEHGGGWVAFEVPVPFDADEVALTYESEGRTFWESLDAEVVESLAEPPAEFELVGFGFPESVEQNESFEVSVVVENASERDGVFRAVLNQTYPTYGPYPIEGTVPAGERWEWTETFSVRTPDDRDTAAAFRLLTPGEKREAEIGVAHETTEGT